MVHVFPLLTRGTHEDRSLRLKRNTRLIRRKEVEATKSLESYSLVTLCEW